MDDNKNYDNDEYLNRKEMRLKREVERRAKVERQKKMLMVGVSAVIVIIIIMALIVKYYPVQSDGTKDVSAQSDESIESESIDEQKETTQDPLSLKKNTEDDINTLVDNYFAAISSCDIEKLAKFVDDIGDITADSLEANAQYIESYENIECYTKPGPYDNTYIVYVYYENKILNIDTLAPSATTLYVIRDENTDTVCIHNGVTTGEIASYMDAVSKEDDVVEFFATVDSKLKEACDSDENLDAFYKALTSASDSQNTETETKSESKETESESSKEESSDE